jgi:hypothetical protein
MKTFLSIMSLVLVCSFSAQAAKLECSSNTSQGLKELVTTIKMKNKVPAQIMQGMQENLEKASTCEEVDQINLAIIGFVVSSI